MISELWVSAILAAVLLVTMVHLFRRRTNRKPASQFDERAADLLAAGLLPLVDCPRDRDACLRCLQVDRCIIHRLTEMGFTPGTQVRVVQDAGGPMLLSVRGSRVALGRDLAERMWVELPVLDTVHCIPREP